MTLLQLSKMKSQGDLMLNSMSKEEMIELGKKGLKVLRQQQQRLKEAGYKLTDYQKAQNMALGLRASGQTRIKGGKMDYIFNENMSRSEIYHNVVLLKNSLSNPDSNIQGRITKERYTLNFISQYLNDDIAKEKDKFRYTRKRNGTYKFTYGDEKGVFTKKELQDFWKVHDEFKQKLHLVNYKTSDQEMLSEMVKIFFRDRKKLSVNEIKIKISKRLEEIYEGRF